MPKGRPRPQHVKDAIRAKLLARYADPEIKRNFVSVVREANGKLTPKMAADIRQMRSDGIGWSEIAARVGVARNTLQAWRKTAGLKVEKRTRWAPEDDALLRSIVGKMAQRLGRTNRAIAWRILELDAQERDFREVKEAA